MAKKSSKNERLKDWILLALVILCVALVLAELVKNVAAHLQNRGSFIQPQAIQFSIERLSPNPYSVISQNTMSSVNSDFDLTASRGTRP